MERLDKIIASQGIYSRNKIKKMAACGKITVDGQMVMKPDIKVDADTAVIVVNGRMLNFRKHMLLIFLGYYFAVSHICIKRM